MHGLIFGQGDHMELCYPNRSNKLQLWSVVYKTPKSRFLRFWIRLNLFYAFCILLLKVLFLGLVITTMFLGWPSFQWHPILAYEVPFLKVLHWSTSFLLMKKVNLCVRFWWCKVTWRAIVGIIQYCISWGPQSGNLQRWWRYLAWLHDPRRWWYRGVFIRCSNIGFWQAYSCYLHLQPYANQGEWKCVYLSVTVPINTELTRHLKHFSLKKYILSYSGFRYEQSFYTWKWYIEVCRILFPNQSIPHSGEWWCVQYVVIQPSELEHPQALEWYCGLWNNWSAAPSQNMDIVKKCWTISLVIQMRCLQVT